jgi:hypothetical protein
LDDFDHQPLLENASSPERSLCKNRRTFMSCQVLSNVHLSAIIRFAQLRNIDTTLRRNSGFDQLTLGTQIAMLYGDVLRKANIDAYVQRYPSDDELTYAFEYKSGALVEPVPFIKLLDSLEYQCRQATNYPTSEACKLIQQMRQDAIRCLPGYEKAPWALEDD